MIYLAAENSRRGPIDALEADFVPLYSTVLLAARAARGRRRRARLRLGRARLRLDRRRRRRRSRSAPRRRGSRGSVGLDVAVEARTHDLDGLVAAVARVRRRDA